MKDKLLFTSEMARMFRISEHTIRYYTKKGLISPSRTTDAGYQLYGFKEIRRLEEILNLKELNMSLQEIKSYLNHEHPDNYRHHLESINEFVTEKIQRLLSIRDSIEYSLDNASRFKDNGSKPFISRVRTRYLLPIFEIETPFSYDIPLDLLYDNIIDRKFNKNIKFTRNVAIYTNSNEHLVCAVVNPKDLEWVDLSTTIELPAGDYLNIFHPTVDNDDYNNRKQIVESYLSDNKLRAHNMSLDLYASNYNIFHDDSETALYQIPVMDK